MKNTPIKKAVFPVAGLGSRFLPATKAQPKEMLPVVDKPLIQYAVEEAVDAGITDLIFVTGRNKRAIEDHFDKAYELEDTLELNGKHELLALVQNIIPKHVNCVFIRQASPLGLGHAVLCAKPIVGKDAFAVILADDFMTVEAQQAGVLKQMLDIHALSGNATIAVQEVPRADVHQYGIVGINQTANRLSNPGRLAKILDIEEKPTVENARSNLAVVGRYVFNNNIFKFIENLPPVVDGEIQLTEAIMALMGQHQVDAYNFIGTRFDCGSKLGYLKATVAMGLAHPELGPAFREYLKAMSFK